MEKRTIEKYWDFWDMYKSRAMSMELKEEEFLQVLEAGYRLHVLDMVESLMNNAPVTTDPQKLGYHYQVMCGIFEQLCNERRFGPAPGPEQAGKRETALAALLDVMEDGKRRFSVFCSDSSMAYRKAIAGFCACFLNMWIQYRETYITLAVESTQIERRYLLDLIFTAVDGQFQKEDRKAFILRTRLDLSRKEMAEMAEKVDSILGMEGENGISLTYEAGMNADTLAEGIRRYTGGSLSSPDEYRGHIDGIFQVRQEHQVRT